ncbi:MAG: methyltetrahydrofolate cobalamin methyltransferase [Clostridiales Family XIII bacterium]|jgi:5-methyltetrahydrofolate--homocysteine methyltransferase|nr:methyltetrahydrofolate cobalamin methyltransferase [Clostridiales Family XIII bacterium]
MIIIGEKINGAIPSTAKAIAERDEAFIRDLAVRQSETGAAYIDVCASTAPEQERETLEWLIGIVQDAVDTPLSLDSPDPQVILDVLPLAKRPGLINSVSDEHGKCEVIFPKVADTGWNIVALTCDDNGLAMEADKKAAIGATIIEKAKANGIAADRLFIDPLVNSLATTGTSLLTFNEAVRLIKAQYPDVHITSGLSNISFGMPFRKALNQYFLCLAASAGMDSAICDPTSADIRAAIFSTEALLGQDEFCLEYLNAFREGLIGPPKQ